MTRPATASPASSTSSALTSISRSRCPTARSQELFQGPGGDRLLGGAEPDPEMVNWDAAVHPDDRPAYDAFNQRAGAGRGLGGHVPPDRSRRDHPLGARPRRMPPAPGRHVRGERDRVRRDRAAAARGRAQAQHARDEGRPPRAGARPCGRRGARRHRRAHGHLQPAPLRSDRHGDAGGERRRVRPAAARRRSLQADQRRLRPRRRRRRPDRPRPPAERRPRARRLPGALGRRGVRHPPARRLLSG